jgi:hypothetical protein
MTKPTEGWASGGAGRYTSRGAGARGGESVSGGFGERFLNA